MNRYLTEKKLITKEEYEEIINKSYAAQFDFVLNIANESYWPPVAYEFHDPKILYKNNEYYVEWKHWSSCQEKK